MQNSQESDQIKKVYIISGPIGVGKTTISELLASKFANTIYVRGDHYLDHLRKTDVPWEQQLKIIWGNLIDIANRYIENGLNVVIDFVIEDEAERVIRQILLNNEDSRKFTLKIVYAVLLASENTLKMRIRKRSSWEKFNRSLELRKILSSHPLHQKFAIDTQEMSPEQVCGYLLKRQSQFQLNGSKLIDSRKCE